MFKKSFIAIAILGATTFSAQAFTLPHNNTTNPSAHAAAGWMVNENFSAVNNELNSQQENIAANKDAIQSNSDRISNLGGLVSDVNIKATAAEMKADSANNKADQNRQDIAANKQGIAKNAETIAKNYTEMKNNFAAMNSRIDDLDEEMKKGFASQAALAGLFQPYNVGKFNLSVALGGYESEQAMGLGTGYRFNENFAMKAGIATDVGGFDHLTYNIGANFEW